MIFLKSKPMKQRLCIIVVLMCVCISCDNSIESPILEEGPYKIHIESYVEKSPNSTIPDKNADIFIYWGISSLEIVGYDLNDDGSLFDDDNHIIYPDVMTKIDEYGKCVLSFPQIDEKMTFIIKSKFVKDKIALTSFTNSRKEILFINTFKVVPNLH